jgi:hypothetical protein
VSGSGRYLLLARHIIQAVVLIDDAPLRYHCTAVLRDRGVASSKQLMVSIKILPILCRVAIGE